MNITLKSFLIALAIFAIVTVIGYLGFQHNEVFVVVGITLMFLFVWYIVYEDINYNV